MRLLLVLQLQIQKIWEQVCLVCFHIIVMLARHSSRGLFVLLPFVSSPFFTILYFISLNQKIIVRYGFINFFVIRLTHGPIILSDLSMVYVPYDTHSIFSVDLLLNF